MKSVRSLPVSTLSHERSETISTPVSGLLILALSVLSGHAFGQTTPVTTTAVQDLSCVGSRGGNVTCTAGEFSTIVQFRAAPGSLQDICTSGSTLNFNGTVGLTNSNTNRYDIGFFIGQEGNDPRATTVGNICSVSVVPSSILPFAPWNNQDGDDCADLPETTTPANYVSWLINDMKVRCRSDASGRLSIPYVVSYAQTATNDASCSVYNVRNGSPSKCNAGNGTLTIDDKPVEVAGYIDLTKQVLPDGDTTPFFFQVSPPPLGAKIYTSYDGGANISPIAASGLVQLLDNQTVRIYMTVLPSPTNRTLTIQEELNSGWQSEASIVCTNVAGSPVITKDNATRSISVSLNETDSAAACTVTNTKTPAIAIAKISNNGTGTFSFSGVPAGAGVTPLFPNITTVTAGVAVKGVAQPVTPGRAYAISENLPSNGSNLTAINCTGLGPGGTQTVNIANRTVLLSAQALSPDANIVCTFTNSFLSSDFSITKTNGVPSLISGASTIYSIRATNNGPDAATGAILSDPAVTGLNKTAVACSAAVSNKCVTAPSVAQLEGGTFALPALVAGEFYEITVTATVTATGY